MSNYLENIEVTMLSLPASDFLSRILKRWMDFLWHAALDVTKLFRVWVMFWGHLLNSHRNCLCLVLADCYLLLLLRVSCCRHVSWAVCGFSVSGRCQPDNSTCVFSLSQCEAAHLTTWLQARKVVANKHQHRRAKKRKREDKRRGIERKAVNYRSQEGEEERTEKRSVLFF